MNQSRQVKQLCSIIHLRPETALHTLLCFAQLSVRLELIQVCKYTHHAWETVCLQDVQKLKGFLQKRQRKSDKNGRAYHLETEASVNDQQNQIGDLCTIDHRIEIV